MDSTVLVGFLVVVVLGVTQALKYANIPTRFIPLVAVLLGIVGSVLTGGVSWLQVLAGVITGLAASGLWSGVKTVVTSTPIDTTPIS